MAVGYVISMLYKKESQKEKERRLNKRPVDNKKAEDIFKELQKTLNDVGRSLEQNPRKPVSQEVIPRETINHEKATKPVYQKPVPKPKYESALKREPLILNQRKVKARHSSIQKKIAASKPMQEIKQEEIQDNYRPDFDLRQAVLYSEILKRPQY